MALWLAMLGALLIQQPAEKQDTEVERLKKEAAELQEKIKNLETKAIEDARTIIRLRQAIRTLEAQLNGGPNGGGTSAGGTESNPKTSPSVGPDRPIIGQVEYRDTEFGFVVVNLGKEDGVEPGYRFDIMRDEYEPGGTVPNRIKLGTAEFEKFMGAENSMSKLKVTEGNIAGIRVGDKAVAIRKLVPVDLTSDPQPPKDTAAGVYRITGRVGDAFMIKFGAKEGARQTQILHAYRDGTFLAKLRLDQVEKEFSIGRIIQGSKAGDVKEGDLVWTREIRNSLVGKVALVDERRGIIVDVREKDGAKVGQRYEVRRQGQKVGTLVLTSLEKWGAYAKPVEGTKLNDIKKDDFVECLDTPEKKKK